MLTTFIHLKKTFAHIVHKNSALATVNKLFVHFKVHLFSTQIGRDDVDRIRLVPSRAQWGVVQTAAFCRGPWKAGNFDTSWRLSTWLWILVGWTCKAVRTEALHSGLTLTPAMSETSPPIVFTYFQRLIWRQGFHSVWWKEKTDVNLVKVGVWIDAVRWEFTVCAENNENLNSGWTKVQPKFDQGISWIGL